MAERRQEPAAFRTVPNAGKDSSMSVSEVLGKNDEENWPALTKGELIAHRDGPSPASNFLRTLSGAEGESEDTRAEARARIGDLLVKEGQI